MAGFSGISDTGWAGDQKMVKDKLIDGKRMLSENYWRWLKMLVVNMMIIQSRLKLDTFYCIGVIN